MIKLFYGINSDFFIKKETENKKIKKIRNLNFKFHVKEMDY